MKGNMKILICFICVISMAECSAIYRNDKIGKTQINYDKELFCSQNVIWQIHFGQGFNNDRITVMIEKDTLCVLDSVLTKNNECTVSYICLYNRNGQHILYKKHNYKLDSLNNINIKANDSLKLNFIIKGQNLPFKEDLRNGKYQQINLYYHTQSKSCIGCL